MADFFLLGQKLGHSFSKPIHEGLGLYEYALKELPDEAALAAFVQSRAFRGCNVTIPYKQTVMPLCDEIDPKAAAIGSVNTLVNRGGRLVGYNTDYDGFAGILRRKNIQLAGRRVMILGTGGTAKTAGAVARDAGAASITFASRHPAGDGQVTYDTARRLADTQVLINTTPAGMYPDNNGLPIDPAVFPNLCAVADVIYNPLRSQLVYAARTLGLPHTGGLAMLVGQAVEAARLFTGQPIADSETDRLLAEMRARLCGLVLVGMPGCGKSRLGKVAARKLKMPFADLDRVLEKQEGRRIPDIFATDGEAAFRRMESAVVAAETAAGGQVLATGGGVVTQPGNLPMLAQNAVVIFIDRPVEELHVGHGRPLSPNSEAVRRLYNERLPLYQQVADATVKNGKRPFMRVAHDIVAAYRQALCD